MNTVQTTVAGISPIINDGILLPIAKAILDGKITGDTADELASKMRQILLLTESVKSTPRPVGIPKTIKSSVPTTETSGYQPRKKGNKYITDDNATCQYIWKKGAQKKGTCCGKPALLDYHLCSTHWKSNSNKKTTKSRAAAPLAVPKTKPVPVKSKETSINLKAYKTDEKLYTTLLPGIPGLVLVKLEEINRKQEGIALAVFDDGNTESPSRDLTSDEKGLAMSRGLSTANKSKVDDKTEIAVALPKIPDTKSAGLPAPSTNGASGLSLPSVGLPAPSTNGASGLSLPSVAAPSTNGASGLSLPSVAAPSTNGASGLSLPSSQVWRVRQPTELAGCHSQVWHLL